MSEKLPTKVRQMVSLLNRQGIHPTMVSPRPVDSAWDIDLGDGYRVSVFGLDYSVTKQDYDDEGGLTAHLSRMMRKHADVLDKLKTYGYKFPSAERRG